MMTARAAEHSTILSTTVAAIAAISLLGVLVGVALSYRAPVERRPVEAPRTRIAHTGGLALA